MLVGRRFLVRGRVQGVGYRFHARAAAHAEGIAGSVRNLDDGAVEVVAVGDDEAVRRFEQQLRQGPPGARVDEVVAEPAPPGGVIDFRILP
jgi:acylphosphatase